MDYRKNIFCKGVLCDKWNRKNRCVVCGVWVCNICSVKSSQDNKIRCIDCYLNTFSPDWDKLNKEFEEMLNHNKNTNLNKNEMPEI